MTIRKSEREVYLSNSLHYWQPGKIHVCRYEIQNDELFGVWNMSTLSDSLKVLEFQIDKMTRNSKI